MPLGAANGITINAGGRLNFNATNDITITDAPIVGGGTIANLGSSTITLNGNNAGFSGSLLVGAGGGVSNLFYATIGLTTNPALNNGALRITNTDAVSGVSAISIAGGNSLARLELANNVTTSSATLTLNGRNPMPVMPAWSGKRQRYQYNRGHCFTCRKRKLICY